MSETIALQIIIAISQFCSTTYYPRAMSREFNTRECTIRLTKCVYKEKQPNAFHLQNCIMSEVEK